MRHFGVRYGGCAFRSAGGILRPFCGAAEILNFIGKAE